MFDWHLKAWLEATDTTQADVVRKTDYPKAKVSDLVTGKQRYNRDILNDIALALNIEPHELLMHPDDAMALRRMRKLAEDMVRIPYAGVAGEIEEQDEVRKAS